jgi:hypothetical protein
VRGDSCAIVAPDAIDVRWRHGLPVTSPARTLVDSGDLTDRELERALDEALVQGIVRLNQVAEALDRLPSLPLPLINRSSSRPASRSTGSPGGR